MSPEEERLLAYRKRIQARERYLLRGIELYEHSSIRNHQDYVASRRIMLSRLRQEHPHLQEWQLLVEYGFSPPYR